MQENQYLVVFGVPSIKKYVFGTSRLKEIRGASALLDQVNIEEIGNFLRYKVGIQEEEIIFIGGGAGQFILSGKKEDADRCLEELEKIFLDKTKGGVRLLSGLAEYRGNNYKDARRLAELISETKKEELPIFPCSQMHIGFMQECKSCSGIATTFFKIGNKVEPLCDICIEKLRFEKKIKQKGSEIGAWDGFLNYLKNEKSIHTERPEDFETIGDLCSAKRGYTAVVYADGNSMGKLIREIDDRECFRFFSDTVDGAIKKACHEALYEIFFQNEKPEILPADILLIGGDDLIVYLTAESALPFAISTARKFNEITKQRFKASEYAFLNEKIGENGLTISIGIAYGKSNTPFSILLDQAEELLKSAKKEGSKDKRTGPYFSPAYLDFHLFTSFNKIEVRDCRADHLVLPGKGKKKIKLYQRPYSLEDAQALLESAQNIKNERIPETRLKRFAAAPFLEKVNGTLEFMKVYGRISKTKQQVVIWKALERFGCTGYPGKITIWNSQENFPIIGNIPWNEEQEEYDSTVLIDLMEIAGFCKAKRGDIYEA